MRIVYMGTPEIAAVILRRLLEAKYEVVLAVTQPDRPKGRGKALAQSPVKELAAAWNVPVFQPEKVRQPEAVQVIREAKPDMIVVAAFGQILSRELLSLPRLGCVNVHASLLPKYRGAAPIQWAILDGEKETGVSIMAMDEGVDTGAVYSRRAVPISDKETGGSLHDKLAEAGASALLEAIPGIADGTLRAVPQGETTTPYAKQLKKEMGRLDFTRSAAELERRIRGLNPWPSAYSYLNGKQCKLWSAEAVPGDGEPGTITEVGRDSFTVQTGDGRLVILELQLEGKPRMKTGDFLRGNRITAGQRFGE
ncbi:MAG: methionyl-tRNA formyltransferase [Lachnospiraceae bacterium]|nr:methionyl-tRNA formyltransferase [Lachnospiraceae bacterium]